MKTRKWWIGGVLILCFAVLGYSREFFFVHLNNLLYLKYYGYSSLVVPNIMKVFDRFDYTSLYWSKYPITLLTIGLFFTLSYISLKLFCGEKKVLTYISYTYLLLLILAVFSMGFGYFINGRLQDEEYTFSRWLLGILQSPIPALFYLALNKLITTSNTQ
jgi:hypothetical protein